VTQLHSRYSSLGIPSSLDTQLRWLRISLFSSSTYELFTPTIAAHILRMFDILKEKTMPAAILAFPAQTSCPVCHRPCCEDELAECYDCGGKMCGLCSTCKCDVLADLVIQRMSEIRDDRQWFVARLWSRASGALCEWIARRSA